MSHDEWNDSDFDYAGNEGDHPSEHRRDADVDVAEDWAQSADILEEEDEGNENGVVEGFDDDDIYLDDFVQFENGSVENSEEGDGVPVLETEKLSGEMESDRQEVANQEPGPIVEREEKLDDVAAKESKSEPESQHPSPLLTNQMGSSKTTQGLPTNVEHSTDSQSNQLHVDDAAQIDGAAKVPVNETDQIKPAGPNQALLQLGSSRQPHGPMRLQNRRQAQPTGTNFSHLPLGFPAGPRGHYPGIVRGPNSLIGQQYRPPLNQLPGSLLPLARPTGLHSPSPLFIGQRPSLVLGGAGQAKRLSVREEYKERQRQTQGQTQTQGRRETQAQTRIETPGQAGRDTPAEGQAKRPRVSAAPTTPQISANDGRESIRNFSQMTGGDNIHSRSTMGEAANSGNFGATTNRMREFATNAGNRGGQQERREAQKWAANLGNRREAQQAAVGRGQPIRPAAFQGPEYQQIPFKVTGNSGHSQGGTVWPNGPGNFGPAIGAAKGNFGEMGRPARRRGMGREERPPFHPDYEPLANEHGPQWLQSDFQDNSSSGYYGSNYDWRGKPQGQFVANHMGEPQGWLGNQPMETARGARSGKPTVHINPRFQQKMLQLNLQAQHNFMPQQPMANQGVSWDPGLWQDQIPLGDNRLQPTNEGPLAGQRHGQDARQMDNMGHSEKNRHRGGANDPPTGKMSCSVLVSNLSTATCEASLTAFLGPAGTVQSLKMDPKVHRATVTFSQPEEAVTARRLFNRHVLDGSVITVIIKTI